jgi:hypothetical protein
MTKQAKALNNNNIIFSPLITCPTSINALVPGLQKKTPKRHTRWQGRDTCTMKGNNLREMHHFKTEKQRKRQKQATGITWLLAAGQALF